jgi:hypothetical protein
MHKFINLVQLILGKMWVQNEIVNTDGLFSIASILNTVTEELQKASQLNSFCSGACRWPTGKHSSLLLKQVEYNNVYRFRMST